MSAISERAQAAIDLESDYACHNYHPIPVVLNKGEGAFVWDTDGKRYYDFLSAYSAVNQGHCHPRLVAAMTEQVGTLTLTSRAFHNDLFGPCTEYMAKLFKYDKVLMMNSGVEAGESAIKLARKWAYLVKKVPENQAMVVMAKNNFWGRTIAACSTSTDPDCYRDYGPFTPGFETVEYGDIAALTAVFEAHSKNMAAFYIEPIQGEAGVVVPPEGYMAAAKQLCEKHNCLFIADEIQTGLARTGKMLAMEHEGVRPDVLVLGKALSGGMMPVSAVLADNEVMMTIKPGEHGSTYGGNPLACRVSVEALKVLVDEKLADNAARLGEIFRARMEDIKGKHSFVETVRGRGLLNAVVVNPDNDQGITAWDVCMGLRERGLLAKPTHDNIIRFAPPLVITEEQLGEGCKIVEETFDHLASTKQKA